jgi:hypothetical protein
MKSIKHKDLFLLICDTSAQPSKKQWSLNVSTPQHSIIPFYVKRVHIGYPRHSKYAMITNEPAGHVNVGQCVHCEVNTEIYMWMYLLHSKFNWHVLALTSK